jgi:hypothetical protein
MQKSDAKLDEARTLALMQSSGEPVTAHEVAAALDIPLQAARAAIRRLCAIGKIARAGEYKKGRPTVYQVVNATPVQQRQMRQNEQWRGVDWSYSTMRPGCLDHERCPSLRGNERAAYQPPQWFVAPSPKQEKAQ